MFTGFVTLDGTLLATLLVTDTSSTPVNADALPTFRVYGPNGFVEEATTSLRDNGTITNATNAGPIVITSTSHGLTTGAYITVADVLGNTAANGNFAVTRVDANSFSLDGSTGNGAYTSGGTWNVTGLYAVTITAMGVDGYEAGETYQIHFTYDVSSTVTSQVLSFQVN